MLSTWILWSDTSITQVNGVWEGARTTVLMTWLGYFFCFVFNCSVQSCLLQAIQTYQRSFLSKLHDSLRRIKVTNLTPSILYTECKLTLLFYAPDISGRYGRQPLLYYMILVTEKSASNVYYVLTLCHLFPLRAS
jgi:hypothetical protein